MRPAAVFVLAFVLLLSLSTLAYSFNLSAYLYDGENASSVTSQALPSSDGVVYTLYTIGGVPSILTADGQPMSDAKAIEAVLRSYYNTALAPSPDERAALRAQLLAFNDSRNFKTRFGKSEDVCMQSVGLATNPCNDTQSCYVTANVVCGLYAAGGGGSGCYPEILEPMLLDFQTHVTNFNAGVKTVLSDLSALDIDHAAGSIAEAQSTIASLKTDAAAQSKTKLRFPEGNDSCPDCVAICPSPHLDTASLDALSASLSNLSTRLSPAYSVSTTSLQISSATADRSTYQQSLALAAIWLPKWTAFKNQYGGLRDNATAVAFYLRDSNFTSAYSSFQSSWTSMENRAAARNYSGVENDLSALQRAVPALQQYVTIGAQPYRDALLAQNHVGDALKQARWSVRLSDSKAVAAYNALVLRKNALDATFTPPLTSTQYNTLTSNYTAMLSDVNLFISSQGQSTSAAGSIGEQFGQASVNGVFSLTDALVTVPPSTRTSLAPAIPPIVLALIDLAVVSIALLVFIAGLYYLRPLLRSRAALGLWVSALFVFLFVLGLGSVGLYALINQSANSGNLGDYLNLLRASNRSYVAIDTAGAPADALAAMTGCSANITAQISARFNNTRPVSVFSYSGKSCTWAGQSNWTYDQCLQKTGGQPIIFLHYNATAASPRFSVVYQKQADVWGNAGDFNKCEIGDVLN